MLILSYLIGLLTRAHGWWGVALVVVVAIAIPVGMALRARRATRED